jgi:hypothetical protein
MTESPQSVIGGACVCAVKNVCNRCVDDDALSSLILEEGEERACDYCGKTPKRHHIRSLSIRELADQIHERIRWEYGDVHSEMISYDNEEGEYTCDTFTTEELLRDQIALEARKEVLQDLDAELPDLTWCKKRFGSSDLAFALEMGWTAFVEIAKDDAGALRTDATLEEPAPNEFPPPEAFGVPYDTEEGVPPERILDAIGRIVVRSNLIRTVDAGTMVFRARVHASNEHPTTAAELGPPSAERASHSNRMSQAGVVMFYGASDSETAILETFQPNRNGASEKVVSVARFRINRRLKVLDLTNLPQPPSFFGDFELHHGTIFLWQFERDFTKPVARDGREHVEYVPTQIVTEYFRHKFRIEGDRTLDGIIYKSSREGGTVACVLFFDSSDCGNTATSCLQLLESATVRIPGPELIERLSRTEGDHD